MYQVVVGVDGSEESERALAWAFELAALRGGSVELVHSYEPPIIVNPDALGAGIDMGELEERSREAAERRLAAIVEGTTAPDGVTLTSTVAPASQPAQALIERSGSVDLLVVGSRGRGGFAGLLLGSVSQQCVNHSSCPVVVVR